MTIPAGAPWRWYALGAVVVLVCFGIWGSYGRVSEGSLPGSAVVRQVQPVAVTTVATRPLSGRRGERAVSPFGGRVVVPAAAAPVAAVQVRAAAPVLRGWLGTEQKRLALLDLGTGAKAVGVGERIGDWEVTAIEHGRVHVRSAGGAAVLTVEEE